MEGFNIRKVVNLIRVGVIKKVLHRESVRVKGTFVLMNPEDDIEIIHRAPRYLEVSQNVTKVNPKMSSSYITSRIDGYQTKHLIISRTGKSNMLVSNRNYVRKHRTPIDTQKIGLIIGATVEITQLKSKSSEPVLRQEIKHHKRFSNKQKIRLVIQNDPLKSQFSEEIGQTPRVPEDANHFKGLD